LVHIFACIGVCLRSKRQNEDGYTEND